MRGKIPIIEGINAGTSYSVLQLMVRDGDVAWAGGATRVAKDLGVAPAGRRQGDRRRRERPDGRSSATRSIGTQVVDIRRDPTRRHESAMGNMVADAMREKYPGVEAAYTNSGGLRADLPCSPPTRGRGDRARSRWGEMFAVLPFGNRDGHRDAHRGADEDRVRERLLGRSATRRSAPAGSRRSPASRSQFHCDGTRPPVIDGIWKTPERARARRRRSVRRTPSGS